MGPSGVDMSRYANMSRSTGQSSVPVARFTFKKARITLEAPPTWRKAPFLKRIAFPYQPELLGPNGEYIGFDSISKLDRMGLRKCGF
jgi:hypothetical protein